MIQFLIIPTKSKSSHKAYKSIKMRFILFVVWEFHSSINVQLIVFFLLDKVNAQMLLFITFIWFELFFFRLFLNLLATLDVLRDNNNFEIIYEAQSKWNLQQTYMLVCLFIIIHFHSILLTVCHRTESKLCESFAKRKHCTKL